MPLLTVLETAKLLNVPAPTIYRLITAGTMPGVVRMSQKIIRIDLAQVEQEWGITLREPATA